MGYNYIKFLLLYIATHCSLVTIGNTDLSTSKNNIDWEQRSHLGFIENKGQLRDISGNPVPYVFYKVEQKDVNIFVTAHGLTYAFFKINEQGEENEH